MDVKSNEDLSHEERERLGHEVKACPQLALAHLHQCKEKKKYIYIYGSPPPEGLPREGGNVSLPSVALNTLKDMLRKHCKFLCFMHTLLVLF